MTKLSPAAQAVRDAVLATYVDNIPKDDSLWALERASTVAALRAAVDEVISPVPPPFADSDEYQRGFLAAHIKYRGLLLLIADELEAQ